MAGIMDILGKGIMPQFRMRGNTSTPFTNVKQDMINTTAAGEAMRQSISDKYSSDLSAFTEGTSALKDIFGKKEASIEDLIPETEKDDLAFDVNIPMNDAPLSYSDVGLTEVPSGLMPEKEYGIKEGIIDIPNRNTSQMNHAVLLTGYSINETIDMKNIIGKIQILENEKEYINRMKPSGLTEATHEGYWLFKHKNGHLLKIHGISWIDYTESTFKCAFSKAE